MTENGEFISVSPDAAVEENLTGLSDTQSRTEELRICSLSVLASDIAQTVGALMEQGAGLSEALDVLGDDFCPRPTEHGAPLPENAERVRMHADVLCALDSVMLSDLIAEALRRQGVGVREEDFLPVLPAPDTVVYVKNALADEAYDVFAQELADPRVRYVPDLSTAVEEVRSGRAGYCILPLEEHGGVRLSSVNTLLYRTDCRIVSVTPVFGPASDADMKYALVAQSFRIPTCAPDDDRYLEIRFSRLDAQDQHRLSLAVSFFGIEWYRMNTSVYSDGEHGEICHNFVFRSEGRSFAGFLLFLALAFPACTPVGIYNDLDE